MDEQLQTHCLPEIKIVYQDEYLVVVNKPAGWLVHRSWLDRHEEKILMQAVRDQIGQHVYTIHRLDKPTSGLLVMALNKEIAHALSVQFEKQTPKKIYHAIVRGYLLDEATIDYPLIEQLDKIADKFATENKTAQSAITHYRSLATVEMPVAIGRYMTCRFSLVELIPVTGRKHQLRRHMSHLHHPIIGDSSHGDLKQNRGFYRSFCEEKGFEPRLFLHASQLQLIHPVTEEVLIFKADIQNDPTWHAILVLFGWNDAC